MPGAISLAGLAAATTGAGLVRLGIPSCITSVVANHTPSTMLIPLSDEREPRDGRIAGAYEELQPHVDAATCVAIGPGLGRSQRLNTLVANLTTRCAAPLVIDADGLNALGTTAQIRQLLTTRSSQHPLVMTPHPGEWQRLSGVSAHERKLQAEVAIEFAGQTGSIVVLKGQHTIITDGKSYIENDTGTPAMATGGSGDVLTGVITALICQGLSPRDAAHLGAHVHGLAAELAEQRLGYHVVLPTELIASLPDAFSQLSTA